tara:strand:+ start:341 stop:553 length:213 start_codon:yes stop_codon:yes gene_type:complete
MKVSKWKVGDLVTLSAAGKKSRGNKNAVGGFGIVVEISDHWSEEYPVLCKWFNARSTTIKFKDYELKRYK